MSHLNIQNRLRRNPPETSLGNFLQNPPWETSYLFSKENKARDCSHSSRARFRAHGKFAQAPELWIGTPSGGLRP